MSVEVIIIILYFIFTIWIGFLAQRRISSSDSSVSDYYAAGRSIGTTVNSLAMMSALGSGGTFLALVGTIWNLGFSYFAWMFAGAIVGFPIASILVARALRNSKELTVSGFLNDRYSNSKFIKVYAPLVILGGSSMYLLSQLTAGGHITTYVTGLPYQWSLILIGIVFILYVSMGGMLAVTWTNVLQGGTMILIMLIIFVAGVINLPGGFGESFKIATETNQNLGTVSEPQRLLSSIGVFIVWATAVSITPHLIMRVFTSTSVKAARLSLNISMLIYATMLLVPAFIMIPFVPTLGEAALANNPPDMWLLLILEDILNPIFMGVIIAGLLAAVMSSTDALLLATSSAVTYDLYYKVINPSASRRKIIKVSMISTWVIGLIVIVLALNPPAFLIVLYTAAIGFMVSSFFAPMILGIWWKLANNKGAVAGMVAGSVSYLFTFFVLEMPTNTEILVSLPLSFIAMFLVSFMTKSETIELVAETKGYHSDIETI